MNTQTKLPVAIIGAGPVGLAGAAHLLERGFAVVILEAGATIAGNLESYRHVRLFSPWQYNIDRAAGALLAADGWRAPAADELPSAGELIDRYLSPLAALPAIAHALRLRHRVLRVSRAAVDKVKTGKRAASPFVLRVATPGGEADLLAGAVLDASGTWSQPNPLGANGMPALGEADARERIAYGMPDILGAQRARYAGKRIMVAGTGHSAAGNLLALARLADAAPATRIVWALRGDSLVKLVGGGAADQLEARGLLGTQVRQLVDAGKLEVRTSFAAVLVERAASGPLRVASVDGAAVDGIDQIIVATGARPDLSITRELRVRLDPSLESSAALAPLIDPNLHSCGTVRPHGHRELAHPEPGYYAVGARSYGRAPNFLMATGYEQVRSIAAALAGDMRAADDVQLRLPETGVCSAGSAPAAGGCCGGPAPAAAKACCMLDAQAKQDGKAGCGCAA